MSDSLLVSPEAFISTHLRHNCLAGLSKRNGCQNVMVVPDPETEGAPSVLTEGQIWACGDCGALHEYYIAYKGGSRYGMVKLLDGVDRRESGEPTVTEFMEDEPPLVDVSKIKVTG